MLQGGEDPYFTRQRMTELIKAMEKAGFGDVRITGEMRMDSPGENDTRWHVSGVLG